VGCCWPNRRAAWNAGARRHSDASCMRRRAGATHVLTLRAAARGVTYSCCVC
jgi:hypothetical protein